jgi:hypothetical protein
MNRMTAAFPDLPCTPPTTVPHFPRIRKNSTVPQMPHRDDSAE